MPGTILTDARVRALRPRKCVYAVREKNLKGFGVRVYPSGERRFLFISSIAGAECGKSSTVLTRRPCAKHGLM